MKIINVLADGSVKDDLTGFLINPKTAKDFYEVMQKINGGIKNKD